MALADVYRDYYLKQLRRLHRDGALVFPADLGHLADAAHYERFIGGLEQFRWVIHCGSPEHCHRPEAALDYLARYVVGASISDTRVLSDQDGTVTLRMKDYRDAGAWKKIRMAGEEFVRRFLLHVLPPHMARVRYCGFLGNRVREKSLARAREQLGVDRRATSAAVPELPGGDKKNLDGDGGGDGGGGDGGGGDGGGEPFDADTPRACPHCGSRSLQWVASFPGTYGWHARVSLAPRTAKERLIRERQAALAGISPPSPPRHVPAPPKVPP